MVFFRVRPDEAIHRAGNIDGQTRWSLPGVECPTCGAEWTNIGEVYPTVDLSDLPEQEHLEAAHSGTPEELDRLRARLRTRVPAAAPLLPGAEFGPFLVSKSSGSFGDFYFLEPWWLMLKPTAMEKLQATGLHGLQGAPLQARPGSAKPPPAMVHLEIPARGRLHPPEGRKPSCSRCGRDAFPLPKAPVLDVKSLPDDVDLFRLANFTTVLVATQSFVRAVEQLGLKGAVFEELALR